MSKLHVGIIFGGNSLESEISILSAKNIIYFIDKDCFEVFVLFIDKLGKWHVSEVSIFLQKNEECFMDIFLNFIKNSCHNAFLLLGCWPYQFMYKDSHVVLKIDLIFPIMHGSMGEDGILQGFLRMSNLPFVGSGVLGSVISMNKDIAKCLLHDAGLKVSPYKTLIYNDYCVHGVDFEYFFDILGLPLFVKPVNQGSSFGVSKVFNKKDFYRALKLAFKFGRKILIESAIVGRELECAVLGNDKLQTSLCGEIVFDDVFYTYQNKYFDTKKVRLIIPAAISGAIAANVRLVAVKAFQSLSCLGMARVDVFLTSNEQIIVNEVNTLPGFTSRSMYPKLWQASGLSCTALITKLIEFAIDLHHNKKIDMNINIES